MGVRAQNRAVGPRSLPPPAPLAGVGADIKTASWGGPNDGSAGPLPGLAGPKGPTGPNTKNASAASNAYAASNGSNVSDASIVAKRYRRFVAYRTTNFDGVIRLVAELLYRVSRICRGSVVYINGRKMRTLLALDAPFHPVDLSVVYEVLSRLGFDIVEQSRSKYVVVRMDNPIMREVKGARSFDEILEIVKKHLNNGG